ncbi:MAG TPA: NAD(P)H-dependent oxidoreductase [Jatrophihabitans sp.]|jgi:FMN-dependent NADH-azoreductase
MTTTLLHINASPRGGASESRRIAEAFLDTYRTEHDDVHLDTWDLWDGTLPAFGPDAVEAKMTVFGGGTPTGDVARAWQHALDAFARFGRADRVLFTVPMWNGGIPYILKQFVDVVSQPGTVFGVDPHEGYTHLLSGRGKKAAVIYTSAVWGPALGPNFGRDFQSTYFTDWLRWTGIEDVLEIRFHPTLTGDVDAARAAADADAREEAKRF